MIPDGPRDIQTFLYHDDPHLLDSQNVSLVPISDGSLEHLSKKKADDLQQHQIEGHLRHSPNCPDCVIADGPKRQHRKVWPSLRRDRVFHIDIMGPLKNTWNNERYVVVGALRIGDMVMYNARATKTKSGLEVTGAVKSMVKELEGLH
eukprot:2139797-Amphidinium_carterae.1